VAASLLSPRTPGAAGGDHHHVSTRKDLASYQLMSCHGGRVLILERVSVMGGGASDAHRVGAWACGHGAGG
jgi:hypothetical protein